MCVFGYIVSLPLYKIPPFERVKLLAQIYQNIPQFRLIHRKIMCN